MSHSSLPPELWRRIIQEATSPPGGLITSWNYTPPEKLFRGWEVLDFVDPTITTKHAVVLVCRQWRTIGIEFLYQWIQFDSQRRVKALMEVFIASSESESSGSDAHPAYGWWVRRIDVAAFMVEIGQLEEFKEFIGLCDRLEIVFQIPPFGFIQGDHDLSLTYHLANRFKHSIRYQRCRTPRKSAVPPTTTLTALSALSFAFSSVEDQIVPDWFFPELQFLKLFNIRDSVVPTILPFLERHGASLIGLHIRTHHHLSDLAFVLSYMTTLQSLVIDQAVLAILSAVGASFPSMSYLGIQLVTHPNRRQRYDVGVIMSSLRRIFTWKILPNLKVVRLLDLEDDDPRSLGGMWLSLLDVCRRDKVELCGKE